MNNYKNLKIWQESIEVVLDIYQITKSFPKEEMYGLTSQLRRAAISIPSNISEGACRNNDKEFKQFLGIASGSAGEADTQLFIAKKLEYITEENYRELSAKLDNIQKKNFNLQKRILESNAKLKTQD